MHRNICNQGELKMRISVLAASLLLTLSANEVVACSDCEYEQCAPLLGCACFAKLGCIIPVAPDIPTPGDVLEKPGESIEKLGNDTLKTVDNLAGDTVKTLQKATGDTVRTVEKASTDTVKTFVKAGEDATATYIKGWGDTIEQAKKSFEDVVDAGEAVANYTANQAKSYESTLKNAEKRVREGKVIDAIWHAGIEPMQTSEENFFIATQQSEIINAAAASTASVYGGPAGAAAYASWSTYKATGDIDMAIRTGLIAAATAQAGSYTSQMPAGTAGEVLKKAAVSAAAGGVAVAAAGGDEKAIQEGFLKSGGAVLVQYGNDRAKAYSPKAKDAWDTVQCISARDVDCVSNTTWAKDAKGKILYDENGKPRVNPTAFDPKQYVGTWSGLDPNSPEWKKNEFITQISKLPKTDAIPALNNMWVLTYTAGKETTIAHGQPTVVLTYMGPKQSFNSIVDYGDADDVPAWAAEPNTTFAKARPFYMCSLGGIDRTVSVRRKGKGCISMYVRSDGKQQIVYESAHYPDKCDAETHRFVKNDLAHKGILCSSGKMENMSTFLGRTRSRLQKK